MCTGVRGAGPRGAWAGLERGGGRAVRGLAFVATLSWWVPWAGDERRAGVDVEVEAGRMVVGRDTTILLSVSVPSGNSRLAEPNPVMLRIIAGVPTYRVARIS